jgi:hypothetical protein
MVVGVPSTSISSKAGEEELGKTSRGRCGASEEEEDRATHWVAVVGVPGTCVSSKVGEEELGKTSRGRCGTSQEED